MKRMLTSLILMALLLAAGAPGPALAAPDTLIVPTFSIVSVITDASVTIQTYNFPQNTSFDVLMGPMGTRGVNGIKAATISSGSGGSFTATFPIPAALHGSYQIAIRLQSNTGSGYYAYNWFYNNTSGIPSPNPNPNPVPGVIPTFFIASVIRDTSVTIQTNNFPKNDSFDVLMGPMGTRGVNGIKVDTVSSGNGGSLTFTFNIPAALYGSHQIAIRLQANTGSGYYAYNWFYNNTTGSSGGSSGYTGFPTFSIASVVRDTSVTVVTYNLPQNEKFNVLMGPMGTRGIGGILVQTIETGSGGSQTLTFAIPDALKGSQQISIRMESISGSGLYAYNWFYNNTTN